MKVLNEWETIHHLIENKRSIARYGDGEFNLCLGKKCISQEFLPKLQTRLCEILRSNNKECMIGIPRIWDRDPKELKWDHWKNYLDKRYTNLFATDVTYGSAFITRPDSSPSIQSIEYYNLVRTMWDEKHVVLVHGEGRNFCKHKSFLQNAHRIDVVHGLGTHAFKEYDKLVDDCTMAASKECVFVIGLGPTATVLAYDLAMMGYQSLDLGHIGMFYNRFMGDMELKKK